MKVPQICNTCQNDKQSSRRQCHDRPPDVQGAGTPRIIVFFDVELALALLPPGVQIRFVSEDGALLAMGEAAYGQTQALLPALDGSNFSLEVSRNLLPGIEAVVGWSVLDRWSRLCALPSHCQRPPDPNATE